MNVVSDTTALIIFAKSGSLNLLSNLFENTYIPQAVYDELMAKNDIVKYSIKEFENITLKPVNDIELLKNIGKLKIDNGEIEAITLAKELGLPLIIDEIKGRKIALDQGLKIVGCLGILIENYKQNILSLDKTKYYFELFKNSGLRISLDLEKLFFEKLALFK
ncbi:MAG: hypothetical protein ACLFOC_02530 [Campylobacterales bacterium]